MYGFEASGKRQFLRFVHAEDNSPQYIQAELDFIYYLNANGYPVASPILSQNGRFIETVVTPSGIYYGVVFEQAAGARLTLQQMSDLQCEAWGRSLASLHELSQAYRPVGERRRNWLDLLEFVSDELNRCSPAETDVQEPADTAEKTGTAEATALLELERLRGELLSLPQSDRDFGLIHYDFELDNVFYVEDELRYCAIDFDDAMMHWFMMDVVSALSNLEEVQDSEAERLEQLFLQGYRSVRSLDERYVELKPLFQRFADLYKLARLLRSVDGLQEDSVPEWALRLREKLLAICDRIREGFQP